MAGPVTMMPSPSADFTRTRDPHGSPSTDGTRLPTEMTAKYFPPRSTERMTLEVTSKSIAPSSPRGHSQILSEILRRRAAFRPLYERSRIEDAMTPLYADRLYLLTLEENVPSCILSWAPAQRLLRFPLIDRGGSRMAAERPNALSH